MTSSLKMQARAMKEKMISKGKNMEKKSRRGRPLQVNQGTLQVPLGRKAAKTSAARRGAAALSLIMSRGQGSEAGRRCFQTLVSQYKILMRYLRRTLSSQVVLEIAEAT